MPPIVNPGSLDEYAWAIPGMLRRTASLASGEGGVPRDAEGSQRGYPQDRLPLAAWTRPALTLCNEDSYSNAEIFSWAFQTLKRGPVVGKRTFGAVISTGGARGSRPTPCSTTSPRTF